MKTLLILVDDSYTDTLKTLLPEDKAWVLDARYDAFRCRLHHAHETYCDSPDTFEAYHDALNDVDLWLSGENA